MKLYSDRIGLYHWYWNQYDNSMIKDYVFYFDNQIINEV